MDQPRINGHVYPQPSQPHEADTKNDAPAPPKGTDYLSGPTPSQLVTAFVFALFATYFIFAIPLVWSATPNNPIAPVLLQTSFEGRFDLGRLYKVRVGRTQTGNPRAPLFGVIETRQGVPVAGCRMTTFEKSKALEPSAMNFECKNTHLFPLGSQVSLLWNKNDVMIQFGTWLSGYERASVEIDRDLLSAARVPLLANSRGPRATTTR